MFIVMELYIYTHVIRAVMCTTIASKGRDMVRGGGGSDWEAHRSAADNGV